MILGTPRSAECSTRPELKAIQTTRQIEFLSESAPTTSAMPVSSSAISEHGKLYIGEGFSDEDLTDEEDTADFIDRTENTANFPAEALDTEKSLPEESVSDRVL
ncbi:hypothetical protein E4U27_005388 [Claviceps purpurea]|nr:hypothetical protein E4U27_005388 [Claviceps purpurea]KAG6273128.1 hypothetical protein E4U49_001424 [Claviceps purpurea]